MVWGFFKMLCRPLSAQYCQRTGSSEPSRIDRALLACLLTSFARSLMSKLCKIDNVKMTWILKFDEAKGLLSPWATAFVLLKQVICRANDTSELL